jgi:hypothetical protein
MLPCLAVIWAFMGLVAIIVKIWKVIQHLNGQECPVQKLLLHFLTGQVQTEEQLCRAVKRLRTFTEGDAGSASGLQVALTSR